MAEDPVVTGVVELINRHRPALEQIAARRGQTLEEFIRELLTTVNTLLAPPTKGG